MAARRTLSVSVKPVTESKTVWVNVVTIIVGVLVWAGTLASDQVTPERIEAIAGTIIVIVGAINAVIRMFFTESPLTTNRKVAARTNHRP